MIKTKNTLDLRQGFTDNEQYKAWVFHGGEVHIKIKNPEKLYAEDEITIISNVTNSNELMLLMISIDTIRKDNYNDKLSVYIPYMPYQQADRDFSCGESFSLKTIAHLLNTLEVNRYYVFDAHSDVTPALLKNCVNIDNSEVIKKVLNSIHTDYNSGDNFRYNGLTFNVEDKLAIISPDSGAYKRVGKLCSKIDWKGDLVAANKYRSISTGNIESLELSKNDFEGKDVLIIDDICVGGRTFIELAKKLKEKNSGNLYLYVSHGVFSNGFKELNHYFKKIFVTDSRKDFLNDNDFSIQHDDDLYKLEVINLFNK